ncbi:TonB-dependent receptor [Reichenbachiella agariperforans]|uniref:TonB-dependent receptor n=1 Tax=Reichenbachiella agariperforans TaxID=156994 RepID=UPI001C09F1A1|nr:carboxypeptidase-like regulatory domain-containing protein [Reichenbachiella agariperforans]MBU2914146.1 carboxypeptidase-like regulatory domain-containing protein [Reichenbachiella agariperforans]
MKTINLVACLLLTHCALSQGFISGVVQDSTTGVSLPFAYVSSPSSNSGVVTNEHGFFSYFLPKGENTISISFVGYITKDITLSLEQDSLLTIDMVKSSESLDEVIITSNRIKRQNLNLTSKSIVIDQLRTLPLVFGEVDIIKGIQFEPGIKSIGEGTSSLFVRGGSDYQNLILMDNIPLYNISHMLGLVSVFNPDAIKSVDLYKTYYPAKYGGRLSSVVDAKQIEGANDKIRVNGGLNALGIRASVQGPLNKNTKASFLVSARSSWLNWFIKPEDDYFPGFADINFRLSLPINNKNSLQVGSYFGKDWIDGYNQYDNNWGNMGLSLNYQSILSKQFFLSSSFVVSSYENQLSIGDSTRNNSWKAGTNDLKLEIALDYYKTSDLSLSFGLSSIYHQFTPGQSNIEDESIDDKDALESALFSDIDWQLNDIITFSIGTRWSTFVNIGNDTWFIKNADGTVKTLTNESGAYHFESNLEPRAKLGFDFNERMGLELGYARNSQYLLVLKNTQLGYTSLESWFPVSPSVKPIISDAVQLASSLNQWGFQFEFASYYQWVNNSPVFVDHARLVNNPQVELELRAGEGRNYGIETSLSKSFGQLNGQMSYVWSRSLVYHSEIQEKEFPTLQDIPHEFKTNLTYTINNHWSIGAYWTFNSGRPYTAPVAFTQVEGRGVAIYGERNQTRYPNYHRMDLMFSWLPSRHKNGYQSSWKLSVYNLYARKNPLAYTFDFHTGGGYNVPTVYQYSFASIFPNLSYEFSF